MCAFADAAQFALGLTGMSVQCSLCCSNIVTLSKQGPIMTILISFPSPSAVPMRNESRSLCNDTAQRVTLGPDGILVIQGWDNSRSFPPLMGRFRS